MKKAFWIIFLILIAGFAMYLWSSAPTAPQQTKPSAAERPAAAGTANKGIPSEAVVPKVQPAPSFQEGGIYLDALSSADLKACKKITSKSLRERCEKEVLGILEEER